MLANVMTSRKMKAARLLISVGLFLSLSGGLCETCGNPHLSSVSVYVEGSLSSLDKENRAFTVLTVHSEDIYAAGNNSLFHLSQNLEIESSFLTDGEENIYKILQVSESLGKLVACSSGGNGGCQLRNLDTVNESSSSNNTYFQDNVVSSGELRTVGIIAPGKLAECSSLYVARGINLNTGSANRPVFERNLMDSGCYDRKTNGMSNLVKPSFVINYSDVFSHGGFVYFLASQRDDATKEDSPIVSKISRICQKDESEDFKAFAELQLACKGESGSRYNITQSAQLIGKDLYIVFNKNGDVVHEYNPQPQSALCVFNMTEIEEKFEDSSYTCACNAGDSGNNSNNNYLRNAKCGLSFLQGFDLKCENLANIRDKFPCSGRIDAVEFFRYPEEPQGRVFSTDAIYEKSDSTFSSLTVTSFPVNDFQRIAFIGTKEGKLLKVSLNQANCSNYEIVDIGTSPVLGDTILYNNNESLLLLTESKLLKMKVANCSQFTTCGECIRPGSPLGDPYCGWCTLKKRCTRYKECPRNNKLSRWLPYNEKECVAIAEVSPNALAREVESQQLQLLITHLPELQVGETYECHFNGWVSEAHVNGDHLYCTSPPRNEIPLVVNYDNHVTMQLHIFSSETGKNFVTREYEFYDCSKIKSCTECVESRWRCNWCKFEHRCTYNSSACRLAITGSFGSQSSNSAESCPQIIPGKTIFVPNAVEKTLSFQAKNLPPDHSYECHLTAKNGCCSEVNYRTRASLLTRDNITFTVTCETRGYSYNKRQQYLGTKLSLNWNSRNKVDSYQSVKMYKCEVNRPDCSRCLSRITAPENLRCVWCEDTCTVNVSCTGEITSPVGGECPAPVIKEVSPSTSSLGGRTHVKLTGSNLGREFEDIRRITLAGEECIPLDDGYMVGESITCVAGASRQVKTGNVVVDIRDQSGNKPNCFSYKDPIIDVFNPKRGPQSGGTLIEIMGKDLDTGGAVEVSIGDVSCFVVSQRTANSITCKTEASRSKFESNINVTFDRTESKLSWRNFIFAEDPTVMSIEPKKSILSGGITLEVTGKNFDLVQRPQILATRQGNEIDSEDCLVSTKTHLHCPSPDVKRDGSRKRRQNDNQPFENDIVIGFQLDGVTSLRNWTKDNGIVFQYFEDPTYYRFRNNESDFNPGSEETILIKGENLDHASSDKDVNVYIGKERCIIKFFGGNHIYCKPPKTQPEAGDIDGNRTQRGLPVLVVQHGLNLRFNIGYVRYSKNPTVNIIVASSVFAVICVAIAWFVISHASKSREKQVDKLLQELDYIKTNVSKELKIFYETLQIALDKFEESKESMVVFKIVGRRQYINNVLFLNTNMKPNDITGPQMVPGLQSVMQNFSELISKSNFLSAFIHALDDDEGLKDEERSKVASFILICFLLEGNVGHLAQMIKILVSEKTGETSRSRSHQLFLGNGSVFDRLLSNLAAVCLYENISNEIAGKILQLFAAIKCIIETGPVDAVTGKTQFSLSFSHMLQSQVEFKELRLNVLFRNECDHVFQISVLSVDSITQVKNKIFDYFAHGQLRYTAEEFDLVLRNRNDEKKIMSDYGIQHLSNGWRKITTMSDYEVSDGACVELVKKLNTSEKYITLNEERHYSCVDVEAIATKLSQQFEADEEYYVPREDYLVPDVEEVSREYEDRYATPEKNKNYYFPYQNSVSIEKIEEQGAQSNSKATYYYPDENFDKGQISSGDDDSSYDEPEPELGRWVWHLMKDDEVSRDAKSENQIDETNLQDIVRPYLPATGSVLQKYVKSVFDALMNPAASPVSCVIKDLFDLFDRIAAEKKTPELANAWKSNVLLRGVYSTILTNPTIICEVKEYNYVQACLEVVDQTMGNICGTECEDDLQGQLFSQLVPVYKTKLESYFKHIKKMKKVEPATLETEYAKVEKAFAGSCDLLSAQYYLYTMLQAHIDQVCEKLQADTDLVRKIRPIQSTFKSTK